MRQARNPVIVVGVGTSLLSLVRDLGARGLDCWVCSAQRGPGTVSRFAKFRRVPDPRFDEVGLIEALIGLARAQAHPPVILTGSDHYAQALARHRDRLSEVAIPCIARAEVVDLLIHKDAFSAWAETHVPSYPRSVPATRFEADGALPFPVVVKPNHRGVASAAARGVPSEEELYARRFTLIGNAEEWAAFQRQHSAYLPHLLVQEYVRGTAASKYSVCVYADRQSRIRACFIGLRLRGFPVPYGDASLVQSDQVPASVLNEVGEMIRALRFEGIAEAEFIRDEGTGAYRLLEMNPRCWGWIGITAASECDIPWIAYQDLTGAALPESVEGPPPGRVKMLFLVHDMANVFARYRRAYPAWAHSPKAWLSSLRTQRLVIWEFDRADWRGTAWCVVCLLVRAAGYLGRRSTERPRSGFPDG